VEGPCSGAAGRADSKSRGPVLQGWPSQRNPIGAEVTAAEIRPGSRDVGSDVEIAATWAKAVRVKALYGPVQVLLARLSIRYRLW